MRRDEGAVSRTERATSSTSGDAPSATSARRAALGHLILGALPTLVLLAAMTVTTGLMVRGHWTPVGDNGLITAYSLDVPSQPPLVGMPTSLSFTAGEPVNHPGPLQFWLLAPTTHLFGAPGYGVAVGTLLISGALVTITALRARRLGGWMPWLVSSASALLVLNGLGPDGITAPYNPNVIVLSLLAALVALWSVLAGDETGLPWFVGTASLAAQAHVSGVPTVGLLVVVAAVAVGADLRSGSPRRSRYLRRILPISVAVGLLCWSGPIIEQFTGSGNLLALLRGGSSTNGTGLAFGVDRLVEAAGIPPTWASRREGGAYQDPTWTQYVTAAAILGGLAAVTIGALRRRDRTTASGPLLALVAGLAGVITSSRIPADGLGSLAPSNRTIWWPASALIWLAALQAAAPLAARVRSVLAARRGLAGSRPRQGPSTAPATATAGRRATTAPTGSASPVTVAGLAATVAATLVAATAGFALVGRVDVGSSVASIQFGQAQVVGAAVDDAVPDGSLIRIFGASGPGPVRSATQFLIPQLRLRGHEVEVTLNDLGPYWDRYRIPHPVTDRPATYLIIAEAGEVEPSDTVRLVARYDPAHPPAAFEGYERTAFGRIGREVMEYFIVLPEDIGP